MHAQLDCGKSSGCCASLKRGLLSTKAIAVSRPGAAHHTAGYDGKRNDQILDALTSIAVSGEIETERELFVPRHAVWRTYASGNEKGRRADGHCSDLTDPFRRRKTKPVFVINDCGKK